MPVKEDNYAEAYIVTREFLVNHKREHYELHAGECTCCIPPFVTFNDIYNEAEPVSNFNKLLSFINATCNACDEIEDCPFVDEDGTCLNDLIKLLSLKEIEE